MEHQSWDSALKLFFKETGLIQALRGFELDMLVLNPAWEQHSVPGALERLVENIKHLPVPEPDTLDDRKAAPYNDLPPPTTLTKSISQYLSRNRARNDASNRAEFLRPPSETSCARTDAKTLNRDTQMKYDIAKNEDGPLRRTMKKNVEEKEVEVEDPALSERITNVETHLAVHYGMHPTVSYSSLNVHSTFSAREPTSKNTVPRTTHHPAREGIPAMGRTSLQPAKTKRKSLSLV
ncbi:hypothetical protein EDD18DRAFT_1062448 [Armillaria luteobubalina]|uniref:Uncharacterized protein n=1 Tax=Armillaria luteobubalina TaxID=153913 RepID=A0AA39QK21_9AGAR|nr:hypothetical protein EDD18DRAFT_1062448 [Armillaria luteobubalina]